jgi:photoactive yellow protein
MHKAVMDMSAHGLIDRLAAASDVELDSLEFGVVKLDRSGHVLAYNHHESEAAGLSRSRVIGRHFFSEVAPCMNNPLVAGRYVDEAELDAEIDYMLALRMKVTAVRLRLLKSVGSAPMFLLVQW